MSDAAISVEGLWKNFRLYQERNQYLKTTLLRGGRTKHEEFWALKDVSFDIESGSTFGIIGSNGSGKSTLLKCLAGILTPDRGLLHVRGRLAALLELGAGFHPDLSGRENIYLNAAILGMTRNETNQNLDEIIDFSGLHQFIDSPVKNYSSGMVVRLGFAVAINVDPEILLIDEVLAVGDESFQQRCYEKIEDFRREGRTIILVSHGLTQITQLCATVAWLDKGKLRALGPALETVSDYSGLSHNAQPVHSGEIGQRWGTREAEIISVKFVDQNENSSTPSTGSFISLRIEYMCHQPIDVVVLGVRISDHHGTNIWGTNTKRRAFKMKTTVGLHCVEYQIPSFPLLAGTYELTATITDQSEVRAFDHWDRRVRFTVDQHHIFDEGNTYLSGKWIQP